MPNNQRDDLFDQLKYGKLDPDAAEAEARRLGLDPLRPSVNVSRFDPAREAQWTICMSVAWIAYRTLDAVRDSWNSYREQCSDWHHKKSRIGFDGEVFEGWFLEQRSPETLPLLLIGDTLMRGEWRDPKFSMTASEAKDALWIALQTDCFRATGVDQQTGERVQIVPFTWIDLKPFEQDGVDEVRPHALGLNGPNRYRDVLIPSVSIRGLWPEAREKPLFTLPETIAPTGYGYMPLTCAAQWIATRGGSTRFAADDVEHWRPAYETLLAAIGSGRVSVIGTRQGSREPVPAYQFVDCPFVCPYEEEDFDFDPNKPTFLRTYTFESKEEWEDRFNDQLVDGRGNVLLQRLVVAKADVITIWPFDLGLPTSSGLPGRPTSRQYILSEFRTRIAAREFLPAVSDEAEYLANWLVTHHPDSPPAGAGAIENMIRKEHREAKAMK